MQDKLKQLDKFHKTRLGYISFGAFELALAYGFATWAIDSGSLWLYLLTAIFLVGALQNIFGLISSTIKKNE